MIGAGAVGGTIGARLAQAGVPVALVARGAHGRAMAADGLLLRTPHGDVRVRPPVWLSASEAEVTTGDVLVMATKTQHLAEALAEWADVPVRGSSRALTAGERLPVVLATNGVAGEAMAARWFRRVFGLCVWSPCVQLVPGEVIARFTPASGVYHVGRVPAGLTDDADRDLVAGLAADWTASGLVVHTPDDVMPWKYRKLLSNLGNVVQALLGTGGRTEVLQAAVSEAREVLAAAGIVVTDDATEAVVRAAGPTVGAVPGAPADLGGSTWQSLARGSGSVETDFLNGEIVRIAHAVGRTAPVNEVLARLGREAARLGRRPGDLSPAQLEAAVAARLGIGTEASRPR